MRRRRSPEPRGAVAVEFALSVVFLVPLLLGILDYGYYFWVSVNAVEAARAGARAAQLSGTLTGCPAAAVTAAGTAATAAANAQMTHIFSAANAAAYTTLPTDTCATTPYNPSWRIQVQVDFPPATGILGAWMPASTRTAGYVRYRTSIIVSPP